MVKAASMGKGGRPFTRVSQDADDYGMPITHIAVLVPIAIMVVGLMIFCFCKCFPENVPECCRICGKRSATKDVELQLGKDTGHEKRRSSAASQRSNNPRRSRSPSPFKVQPNNNQSFAANDCNAFKTTQNNLLPYGLTPSQTYNYNEECPTYKPPPPPSYQQFSTETKIQPFP